VAYEELSSGSLVV